MSATFKTEVDFVIDDEKAKRPLDQQVSLSSTATGKTSSNQQRQVDGTRLPASVNLVALRESFLSEAPFISNTNRSFWRRMVDNANFQMLLSASYYIIADCVSETSVVDTEKLDDIKNTPLISKMATNIAEMYYSIKLREREIFFAKLPEVLAFMALTALRTAMPKHHRLCLSAKFREILIDWYCEVVGGLRFTNCRTNREWLFTDVFDAQIVTAAQLKGNSSPSNSSKLVERPDVTTKADPSPAKGEQSTITVSKHKIGLSPLVSRYTSDASLADLEVKMSLSHLSNRTITSLDTKNTLAVGRPRTKKVDYKSVKDVLRKSQKNRQKIMSKLAKSKRDGNYELIKSREKLHTQLMELNKTSAAEVLKARTLASTSTVLPTNSN